MTRAVTLANLADSNIFTVDGTNDRVGIGSTQPTAKLDVAGIVTATAFYGDGSNLEGVASAGLGTALSDTDGDSNSVIYFTNTTLGIGSTVIVDPPSTSTVAYTQYQEVSLDADVDLIVAEGDDFVPDILGLGENAMTFGISGSGSAAGGSSGISNVVEDTTPQLGGNLDLNSKTIDGNGNININGTITASSFVGVGTADVSTSTLNVTGISTFNNSVNHGDNVKALFGDGNDLEIYHDGSNSRIVDTGDGELRLDSNSLRIRNAAGTETSAVFVQDGKVELRYDNVNKFETATDGVHVTGIASASTHVSSGIVTYYGDSSYSAAGRWVLNASGTDHYTFTGPGLGHSTLNDPTLYLMRGQTYMFENKMGAHPFRIQSTSNGSTGTQWNVGVTNNDVSNGVLIFEVPFVCPNTLYYQCTAHANMGGVLNIVT